MTRFTKTASGPEHDGSGTVEEYTLELRPGHTITRVDKISRLGAGHKGRAASVDVHRTLTCTCGGHLGFGGLTVAEDLAHLVHFESPAERDAYHADMEERKQAILRSLGMAS